MQSILYEKLKKKVFSKENISELYINILSINNLKNLDNNMKTFLTTKLVQMMKSIFEKIDGNRINNNNFETIINGFNSLVLNKMSDLIKKNNIGSGNSNQHNIISDRPQ
jgi:uncharacterized protein with ACT and thioredoxin-like domain